jgi:excisionase family DNA binding protein
MLGVHGTTLRRWADAGTIPVYITPGGHRRFALADIQAMSERKTDGGYSLAHTWARRALAQARTGVQQTDQSPQWLARLPEAERDNWRRVSMQLMGLVLRFVNAQDDDDELLNEARTIGSSYAVYALQARLPLTTALEVSLFFRDSLVSAALDLPEHASLHADSSAHLLQRISQVLNVVQLAVVAHYEAHQQPAPSPSLPEDDLDIPTDEEGA